MSRSVAIVPRPGEAESGVSPVGARFPRAPWLVLGGMTILYAVVFAFLSEARHQAFQSHAFDLGNMDQAVWNTLHGHFLRFTDMAVHGRVLTSRLAIHVEPILVVFAFLYLIHPGPETLLAGQAVIVALGSIPAYLLARTATDNAWLALVFPLAYLLHPSLQNAVLDDFHAVTLTACFLLWALYFAYRNQAIPFAVFALLAMACKEEVGLMVALLGLIFLYRRRGILGLVTLAGGIGWFIICLRLIIPANNPAGQSPYLSRYAYLGHGIGGILRGAVEHPDRVVGAIFSTPRLGYVSDLLHPVGFVTVLAIPVLLLALPALLINMLSADPRMYSGFYQYSAEIVPYVIAGAAIGAGALSRRTTGAGGARWLLPALCLLVVVAAGYDSWRYGFTPLSSGYIVPSAGMHQEIERSVLDLIPPNAVVAAADEIEPHLSDRSWVYVLPTIHPSNGPKARYIVVDASIPSLPVTPYTLHRTVESALRHGYGIIAARDGVLLLEYHAGTTKGRFPSFFSYLFTAGNHVTPERIRWGPLELVGIVIHPREGAVNRSRPAISLETYWRVRGRLPARTNIRFALSPVYQGSHPPLSLAWQQDRDSPAWVWLSLQNWPAGRTIRAVSLPLIPPSGAQGQVDVSVEVEGLGTASGAGHRVIGNDHDAVRLATVTVNQ